MANDPLILAVETSSRVGSVALAEGPVLLSETSFSAPLRHSSEVLPAVGALLERFGRKPDNITQVYIAAGPGSFTGLRIAVAMAKAMHLANSAAIVTVDSLDAIVANVGDAPGAALIHQSGGATPADHVAALLDAKRGQFYTAVYERATRSESTGTGEEYEIPAGGNCVWRKVLADCLMGAAELVARFAGRESLAVCGDGLLYHRDEFAAHNVVVLDEPYWSPRASQVHALGYQKARAGRFADPLTLTPFYLRGPEVTVRARA